jgi:hypothetical protein
MDSSPNYSSYSLEELYDTLENINHEEYPERVIAIKAIIQEKRDINPEEFKTEEKKKSGFTSKDKYQLLLLILSIVFVFTLYLGYLPIRGVSWITKEEQPLYYWSAVSGLIVWAIYYVIKYRKEE